MLAALASALAARDPLTAAHSARVTSLADRLASWLGWDERRLRALKVAGPLHDIGKVMISQAILQKRGPLAPDELAEISTHPSAGARRRRPRRSSRASSDRGPGRRGRSRGAFPPGGPPTAV